MKKKTLKTNSATNSIKEYYENEKTMADIVGYIGIKYKLLSDKEKELFLLEIENEQYESLCFEILELHLHVFFFEHYLYKREPINQMKALRKMKKNVSLFVNKSNCHNLIPDFVSKLDSDIANAIRINNTFSVIDSELINQESRNPEDISDNEFLLVTVDNLEMVKEFSRFLKQGFYSPAESTKKIRWNIQPEKFGNLFLTLAKKQYFDLPTYHGEGSYQTLANLLYSLMDVNETSIGNLQRAMNPKRNTSFIKNENIFNIPDVKALNKM